jgi:hypothetical protein
MFSIPTSLAVFPTTMLILRTRRHVEHCMVRSFRTIPDLSHFHNIVQQKHGHRGSHDKISACDWLDTHHRGSKWQEVTIFSNIRTVDRGSKSQSHFTNIFRTTKNDELRVVLGYRRSKHSTSANEGFSLPPRQAFFEGFS